MTADPRIVPVVCLGVVTPMFNPRADFLLECLHSVKAQAGLSDTVNVHVWHHVQDGGSDARLVEELAQWQNRGDHQPGYRFSYASAPDGGMYDAINKGFDRLVGEVDWLLHLNSDEQILPSAVRDLLSKPCNADVLLANTVVLDEAGRYICSRRPFPPWPAYIRVWIPAQTCATFVSAMFMQQAQARYNEEWKAIADKQWFIDLFAAGARFKCVDIFTSLFRHAATNLGYSKQMDAEKAAIWYQQPVWVRIAAPLIVGHLRVRRLWRHGISRKLRQIRFFNAEGTIGMLQIKDRLRWGMRGWRP